MPKPLSCKDFTTEEYNALFSAITTAAHNRGSEGPYCEYELLEDTPRTTLVVVLIEALHEHGYKIKKIT